MSELGRRMARGAAWMVLFKTLERGMGLITTLVLARLLVPEDFGVVAMATSTIALLEIFAGFSFDIALIQKQDAEEAHYHTAFTLNLLVYATMAALMVLLASPVAAFYREPRVENVLRALAIGVLLVGFENIGTVAFRKELTMHRDFSFLLAKKLIAAIVGIGTAIAFRSYWALVAGMVTSRFIGVVLSYLVHPFRPRLSLARAREMIGFSFGLFTYYAIVALTARLPDFLIGRVAGPVGLGTYNISYELANLPTTELLMPIHRAILPGYAIMASDDESLRTGFLTVFGLVALAFVPAAVGISVVADPLVHTLLGDKWTAAAPVIQILAFAGLFTVVQSNANYVFMARGKMAKATRIGIVELMMLLPAIIIGLRTSGTVGAAWGVLLATCAIVPVVFVALRAELGIRLSHYFARLWRPTLAAAVMFGALTAWMRFAASTRIGDSHAATLLSAIAVGASAYGLAMYVIWRLAGRPEGAESVVLHAVRQKLRGSRDRMRPQERSP